MTLKQLSAECQLDSDFCPGGAKVNLLEYTKGKKAQDELKALGIEEVMLYCVNDMAVMKAWAEDQKVGETMIKFYGDPTSAFTRYMDMEMTHPGPVSVGLLGRCKRFALYIDDGAVKYQALAEDLDFDPAGDDFPEKVLPPQMMEAIKKVQSE